MASPRRRSQTSFPKYLIVLGVLLAGCALTYGIVRAAGWLDQKAPLAQQPSREGRVKVPKSLINLRAYEVVRREDIYNRELGDDSYFWLPEAQVADNPQWITRVDDIIGRVMARDKDRDFVFSEKDFLPEGSRSGIAGGIPEGKQGFFLDAEQIPGLRFLKSGDQFDLLASPSKKSNTEATTEYGLLVGGIKARGGKPVPPSGVRVLARNASMIALTTPRAMTTQGGLNLEATDSRGRSTLNARDERVAIAIDPAEAVPLTQALGEDLEIYMVTRSGQESEDDSNVDLLKGRIALPATAVAVEAYQPIKASDLSEPDTGELRQYYFNPADVQDNWITRPEQLIGRVVRRAIEPGYLFTEDDFLPSGSLVSAVEAYEPLRPTDLVDGRSSPWVGRVASRDLAAGSLVQEEDLLPAGARAGFSAAIPGNRVAMSVSVEDVNGLSELSRGDRCDLLASIAFDAKSALNGIQLSPALANDLQSRTSNRVLAQGAIVIETLEEQVVLAVTAGEVSLVAKAITNEAPVFCIALSNQGDQSNPRVETQNTELESDPNPLGDIMITETLIGGRRSAQAFRRQP